MKGQRFRMNGLFRAQWWQHHAASWWRSVKTFPRKHLDVERRDALTHLWFLILRFSCFPAQIPIRLTPPPQPDIRPDNVWTNPISPQDAAGSHTTLPSWGSPPWNFLLFCFSLWGQTVKKRKKTALKPSKHVNNRRKRCCGEWVWINMRGNLLSVQTSQSAARRARGRCEGREHDYMEDKEREWEEEWICDDQRRKNWEKRWKTTERRRSGWRWADRGAEGKTDDGRENKSAHVAVGLQRTLKQKNTGSFLPEKLRFNKKKHNFTTLVFPLNKKYNKITRE